MLKKLNLFILISLLLSCSVAWGDFPKAGQYVIEWGNGDILIVNTGDPRVKKVAKLYEKDGAIMQDYLYYNGYATNEENMLTRILGKKK